MKRNIVILLAVAFCLLFSFSVSFASENIHVVKKGDNIWKILKKYYGQEMVNMSICKKVAKINGILNPHKIYAGQRLAIPELATLKRTSKKVVEIQDDNSRNINSVAVTNIGIAEPRIEEASRNASDVEKGLIIESKTSLPNENTSNKSGNVKNEEKIQKEDSIELIEIVWAKKKEKVEVKKFENNSTAKVELRSENGNAGTENFQNVSNTKVEGYFLKSMRVDFEEAEKNKFEFNGSIGAFYGCPDILSSCKGGNAEVDFYKKNSNLGFNLQAYGAYGTVTEDQFIWYKISAGGGLNYRHYSGNLSILAKQSLLFQTYKSSTYGFNSSQLELLSAQYLEAMYQQNSHFAWGINLAWTTPVAMLHFKTDMPGGQKTYQSKGEIGLVTQWQMNNSLKSSLKYSPIFYQEGNALLGSMGTIELEYKKFLIVYGGIIFYPYDNLPKYLTDNGVNASRIMNGIGGIKIQF